MDKKFLDYKIKAFRPWPERFLGYYFDNEEREFTAFYAGFSFPKGTRIRMVAPCP